MFFLSFYIDFIKTIYYNNIGRYLVARRDDGVVDLSTCMYTYTELPYVKEDDGYG